MSEGWKPYEWGGPDRGWSDCSGYLAEWLRDPMALWRSTGEPLPLWEARHDDGEVVVHVGGVSMEGTHVFDPDEAREFAKLLLKLADEADRYRSEGA